MSKQTVALAVALTTAATLTSCGSVFDDLYPCAEGVSMRFVYDYNLDGANAFPSQVDCLTLHIYDSEGRHLTTVTETSTSLSDENWRMQLDLPAGSYHAIAYGGISCDKASFAHATEPGASSHYTQIAMRLKDGQAGTRLHDHFHGAVDFTVKPVDHSYTSVTMPMTKTTNHLRFLLQQLDNQPVDGRDYEFYITDDNTELDHRNRPVAGHPITYHAWTTGQVSTADANTESRAVEDVKVGYGEVSTSRLHLSTSPKLTIYSKQSQQNIIEIPLNSYLLLGKSEADGWSNQEYLDRNSRWTITFLLDRNNQWAQTHIIINGWTVRIPTIEH